MHDSSQNDEIAQEVSCDSLDENMSINNSSLSTTFTTAGREKELLAPILVVRYRVGQKKLYPPTFLLTLAVLFKLTQKFLWIMAAAGSDDNNNIKWTTQMKKILF